MKKRKNKMDNKLMNKMLHGTVMRIKNIKDFEDKLNKLRELKPLIDKKLEGPNKKFYELDNNSVEMILDEIEKLDYDRSRVEKYDIEQYRRLDKEEITITKAEYQELLDKARIYYNTAGDTKHCMICGHIVSEGLRCFTCGEDDSYYDEMTTDELLEIRKRYMLK